MDAAVLSALSALAGSVIGGLTAGLANWLNQRAQARADQLAHKLSHREDLFRDFIIAASKAYGEAVMSDKPQVPELIALYGMISRMRVLCIPQTVECADKVLRTITDAYGAPNKTLQELHEMIKTSTAIDPLRDFAEAARAELGNYSLL